jgi:putative transposase
MEIYQGLKEFFDYYNNKKTHQGIERQIPASLYKKAA